MSSKRQSPKARILSMSDTRRVAVAAEVDPRTVDRALAAQPIRPASLTRVKRALRKYGLGELLPEDEILLAQREARQRAAEARAIRCVRAAVAPVTPPRNVVEVP